MLISVLQNIPYIVKETASVTGVGAVVTRKAVYIGQEMVIHAQSEITDFGALSGQEYISSAVEK
jgi:hypothetical protein